LDVALEGAALVGGEGAGRATEQLLQGRAGRAVPVLLIGQEVEPERAADQRQVEVAARERAALPVEQLRGRQRLYDDLAGDPGELLLDQPGAVGPAAGARRDRPAVRPP